MVKWGACLERSVRRSPVGGVSGGRLRCLRKTARKVSGTAFYLPLAIGSRTRAGRGIVSRRLDEGHRALRRVPGRRQVLDMAVHDRAKPQHRSSTEDEAPGACLPGCRAAGLESAHGRAPAEPRPPCEATSRIRVGRTEDGVNRLCPGLERRKRDREEYLIEPEAERAIGKCYQVLGDAAEARKSLKRPAGHRETRARAEEALRELLLSSAQELLIGGTGAEALASWDVCSRSDAR
jgi:hypothetical protein